MASGGRGGPPWADPRMFKAMFWGGPGGPGGPAVTAAVPIGAADVPVAATCARRSCS